MTATSRPLESPMLRYKLRTLLIVVVIVALPLVWVGSQYRIVTARRAIRADLEGSDRPTATFYYGEPSENCTRHIEGDRARRPSRFRLWLGDEQVDSILFDEVDAPKRAAIEAFPEADIYFWF